MRHLTKSNDWITDIILFRRSASALSGWGSFFWGPPVSRCEPRPWIPEYL